MTSNATSDSGAGPKKPSGPPQFDGDSLKLSPPSALQSLPGPGDGGRLAMGPLDRAEAEDGQILSRTFEIEKQTSPAMECPDNPTSSEEGLVGCKSGQDSDSQSSHPERVTAGHSEGADATECRIDPAASARCRIREPEIVTAGDGFTIALTVVSLVVTVQRLNLP